MIKVEQMIKDLKYLEAKRRTLYAQPFPYNCGYLYPSGWMGFDCINMIKSYINDPACVYRTKPAGSYVMPGRVIPDTTETGILNLCSGRSRDFSKIFPGAYMLYDTYGHGSIYIGEFKDPSGVVNTIECCNDPIGNGVVTSYTDETGQRWDHKGGSCFGRYVEYGYLTKYIDYSGLKKKKTETKKKSITTIAKEVIAGKWGNYPERKTKLEKAGYDYEKVQAKVNALLKK